MTRQVDVELSSGNGSSRADGSEGAEDVLLWTVHLARRSPGKLAVCAGVLAAASTAAFYVVGPLASVAVAAALTASVADFLFPVTYRIDADGAEVKMLHRRNAIKWRDVRRCYIDDFGIKLSPLERPSRMEAFRGVYLRFAGNEGEVTEAVKAMRRQRCSE